MIPHGRPVISEPELAAEAGQPLTTWRQGSEAATIRRRLTRVNEGPGERAYLYDLDQVRALQEGRRIPRRAAEPAPHSDDLLTPQEMAAELGVSASTVRAYATRGVIPPPTDHYGPRWPRRTAADRQAAGDQRRADSSGAKVTTARERIAAVAQWLTAADRGDRAPVTLAQITDAYGVSERTAIRTLAAARDITRSK